MQFVDLVGASSRIIEINPVDGALGSRLVAAGCARYLAVANSPRRRDAISDKHPALAGRVTVAGRTGAVRQNNAEVLILNGQSSLHMATFRSVRHARFVAIPLSLTPHFGLALQLGLLQCALGRFALPRIVSIDGSRNAAKLLVFRVRRQRPHSGARRFIPHALGVEGFLRKLQAGKVRHAVLRWFEALPRLAAGEDVDLLVDDADLERVRALLDAGPGVQPVDLYSVTGLPGADYGKMTYFPPYLADELLERAVDLRGLCKVPSPREHFLSLAYHVLYHKGLDSGLARRGENRPQRVCPDHDYTAILGKLAARIGIDVPITLEDLDECLDSQGWRPPQDMLVRLAKRNAWIRTLLTPAANERHDNGLAVFLIREEATRRGGVEKAVRWLEKEGFRILDVHHFDARLSNLIARSTRGGNWGQGPWCNSGGKPIAAIVVYDPNPIRPSRRRKKRQPQVANARLFCKDALRDYFNEGFPKEQHCNVVHSSDNGRESMDYLRIIMPEKIDQVLAGIESVKLARAA
ncbi:MAG: hypothetical protein L0228_07610 [Planctomycetes bacterium]|nr:hypothetical protein [Planctomycetota bacterium]